MKKKNKEKSTFAIWWKWPLIVLGLSFILSLAFGVVSQVALSGAGLAVSIVVILVFILIAIVSDMVGVAITAASFEPFRAMAARKVRGAKESIKLLQNKEKVGSVFADVIGDICGILSGAAGATITAILILKVADSFLEVLIASIVSAVIAALTIFGKAYCKKYSMVHSEKIILILGKFISLFTRQNKKENKKKIQKKPVINDLEVKNFIKPDFNNNILNVSASLAEFLGCKNDYKTLPILNKALKNNYKNIVFIIFDGLGINPLKINLKKDDFLNKNIKQTLTTVFPSTTTNATSTLLTNRPPLVHGMLGWSMYMSQLGKNVDVYPACDSRTGEKVDPQLINSRFRLQPYYKDAKTDYVISKVVPPYWKDGTESNIVNYQGLDEFLSKIENICQSKDKNFIYCYFSDIDQTMHKYGVSSNEAKAIITQVNDKMKLLCEKLEDTLFILTADHGQVDIDGFVELYKDEELSSCLQTPPYLEPRAAAFKVKEGEKEKFEKLFLERYSQDFKLYTTSFLIKNGYFGERFIDNEALLGDYIAICTNNKQFLVYNDMPRFKGNHSSLTKEMLVPLIIIESNRER